MEKRIIPISLPVTGDDEWQALKEPLETGWLTAGPKVRAFEDAFAERHQVKYAIAVTSATTALHLALIALDIKAGDEVIVPAFTWVSTANVVLYQGAEVVFCDIDPTTFNLDPRKLKDKITSKTKAIMVVHLFGLCAPMDEIKTIAGDIPLIEDGACAAGSAYKGLPAGGLGLMGCFSFHPRKSITTGEGGMITTNDSEIYKKLLLLRSHGITKDPNALIESHGDWYYEMQSLGYNYRMPDLLCALGISQLDRAEENLISRRKIAKKYFKAFSGIPITIPKSSLHPGHAFHLFVIQVEERKAFYDYLKEKGINAQIHYIPVHKQPYYIEQYGEQVFKHAEEYYERCISIPIYPSLSNNDQDYVIETIVQFYKKSHV